MTDQHRYTARPVDPDLERAALERARQAAADSETAAAWYATHSSTEKERDQYGREADRLRCDWTTMRDRAEQAEAVVARVREAAAWICRNYPGLTTANERLAAALDTEPAATDVPELIAEEARDLAAELATDLYRAQDALAFVAECCNIADRNQQAITTGDVRTWLKGAQCGRQLAADQPDLHDKITEVAAEATGGSCSPAAPETEPNDPPRPPTV